MMTCLRELFGGAIKMRLPSNLLDASDLRQIPDTQEVFLDPGSDVSFVVEILQRVDIKDAEAAIKFHFDSLAHDNSATSQDISDIAVPHGIPTASNLATPRPIILSGKQEVRKFNRSVPDQVHIFVALYRIEAKGVDLVFTANIPVSTGQCPQSDDEAFQTLKGIFDAAATSLTVVDFNLFL